MPHYGTLDDTFDNNKISLDLPGWNPLIVEYGYKELNDVLYLHWRVKGTAHIFTIQSQQVNKLNTTLDEHFKVALAAFRNDFMDWRKDKFAHKWQREYSYIFKNFITF